MVGPLDRGSVSDLAGCVKVGDVVQHRIWRARMVVVNVWERGKVLVCQRWDEGKGGFTTKAYSVRDIELLEKA